MARAIIATDVQYQTTYMVSQVHVRRIIPWDFEDFAPGDNDNYGHKEEKDIATCLLHIAFVQKKSTSTALNSCNGYVSTGAWQDRRANLYVWKGMWH